MDYMENLEDSFKEEDESFNENVRVLSDSPEMLKKLLAITGERTDEYKELNAKLIALKEKNLPEDEFIEEFAVLEGERLNADRRFMESEADILREAIMLKQQEKQKELEGELRSLLRKKDRLDVGSKIYPNDPCPCGSGKKYKKCCGNPNRDVTRLQVDKSENAITDDP